MAARSAKPVLPALLLGLAVALTSVVTAPAAVAVTTTAPARVLAGVASPLDAPAGVATDGINLYIADTGNHTIRKEVLATGAVTTLAGSPGGGNNGSQNGTGGAARFYSPEGVATDGTNVYVADSSNNLIRKVVIATGVVSTVAGSGATGGADGTGTAATFNLPKGVATVGTDLYVADSENSTIRKIAIASGVVTTVAGAKGVPGNADGTGGASGTARFSRPQGLATDGTNLYVADTDNSTIRKVVIATGAVTTMAGLPGTTGSADGTGGAGGTARFNRPEGIAVSGPSLFVADTLNHTVRKVTIADGAVMTLAGMAGVGGTADGTGGLGGTSRLRRTQGLSTDGTNVYVADTGNSRMRKIVIASGTVTTFSQTVGAAGGADGTGAAAQFFAPAGLATDGPNLYVADRDNATIRKVVIGTGAVTTLAGMADVPPGSTDGTGSAARFNRPNGVARSGGFLYVADTGNHTIRKLEIATGVVTTLAGSAGLSGSIDGTPGLARFSSPAAIATDGTNLYVADAFNYTIRQVVIATGVVSTLAGSPGLLGNTDGTGTSARFFVPNGVTVAGPNLYVSDTFNHTIRRVVIATGVVTTLAGVAQGSGSTDGTGSAARFDAPMGLVSDGTDLYIADSHNARIRKMTIATNAVSTLSGVPGAATPLVSATPAAVGGVEVAVEGGITISAGRVFVGIPHGVVAIGEATVSHPKVADFDGNGTSDISVFRPSTGQWFVQGQTTTFHGASGDLPVPCDYNGDGTVDKAVFRPSVGGWYITGQPTVFFGLNGDIPVPGYYTGTATCLVAVFRPSVGGWYIQGQPTVFFGLSGDIPVPADYDGNGATDISVFRPTVGGWYRNGAATTFFGLNGDIPVPGDYDGSGTTDIAIFRKSVGGWYIQGQSSQFLGLSTDVPVPGDYDGDGDTEIAVFRPSTGAWYVGAQSPVNLGTSTDIPLPLPTAIRQAFF
jgi:hypothetical protein